MEIWLRSSEDLYTGLAEGQVPLLQKAEADDLQEPFDH